MESSYSWPFRRCSAIDISLPISDVFWEKPAIANASELKVKVNAVIRRWLISRCFLTGHSDLERARVEHIPCLANAVIMRLCRRGAAFGRFANWANRYPHSIA